MTEAEWLVCTDPKPMLEWLSGRASDRKLRLFACACCRRIWHLLLDVRQREGIEAAERYADGLATPQELARHGEGVNSAFQEINAACRGRGRRLDDPVIIRTYAAHPVQLLFFPESPLALQVAESSSVPPALVERAKTAPGPRRNQRADTVRDATRSVERAAQCALLRDTFGNLFRPIDPGPKWRTPAVASLAQAAYNEQILASCELEPARLAVLADALEDAGCTDPAILTHLRGPGPHVRGCWALDLVLGKE